MSSTTKKASTKNVERGKATSKKHAKSDGRAVDTVSERRTRDGETVQKAAKGSKARRRSLATRRRKELTKLARTILTKGRSKMDKARLVKAARDAY